MRRLLPLLAALLGLAACSHAQATPAGATYYSQSLMCREKATGADCTLWLNPDGRYAVFYVTKAGGLRLEGREGTFQATAASGGISLCLRPDPDAPPRKSAGIALFHDQGCLTLQVHPIGEAYTLSFGGQAYTVVLAQGR